MIRALVVATLLLVGPCAASGQERGVLHIKVVLVDAAQKATPVARHVLFVSDNPASAPPRRVVTSVDGTSDVKLPPGTYTVESDRPVAFNGLAYQWTQMVEIEAGRDATLELTAENAEVGPVTPAAATAATSVAPAENDPSFLLSRWQDSVVAVWTPTSRASAFVVDARGLVVTNQRDIGNLPTVEVQLTPAVKVAARVIASDPVRDVAVLWIDATVAGSRRPVPLECAQAARSSLADEQEIFTIGAPLRGQKNLTAGTLTRVGSCTFVADFRLGAGGTGGPVFTAGGEVIGMTAEVEELEERRRGDSRVIPLDGVCEVLRSAEKAIGNGAAPSATHLPVEPTRPFPLDALEERTQGRTGLLAPYQMSSSDFDIAFITPVLAYAARQQADQGGGRTSSDSIDSAPERTRLLTEFSNWSDDVSDVPPVLLVRVTPKLAEGFWTMVARGAAQTQGMSLPPMKRFKSGLARLRASWGADEVTPIHVFELAPLVVMNQTTTESLYVFDPGALGPHCGTVTLVLYSEKGGEKGDTRVVDPKVLQQIWDDFAPYRSAEPALDARGV